MTLRDLGKSVGGSVLRRVGRVASSVQESRPIPVDLLESDDAFLAVFDAAGATGSDVQVRFSRGAIRVRIDRFREPHDDYEMRFPGRGLSLEGNVDIPENVAVDAEAATATLTDAGTLEVLLPKVEGERSTDETRDDETSTDSGSSVDVASGS